MNALAALIDRSCREREDWRYTDVEKLLAAEWEKPAKPVKAMPDLPSRIKDPSRRQRIVFVDGVWRQDLTQLGQLPPAVLRGDALNGYRLSFAPQTCLVTAPIELVFVSRDAEETALNLVIEVGSNSSLTMVEHYVNENARPSAQIVEMDVLLDSQAKLAHGKIVHDLSGVSHFARARVRVESGAYYHNVMLVKDARLLRHEVEVTLAGPMAQCGLFGAMLLRSHEHADVLTRVIHAAPHGTSRQLYKAVVRDSARGVFQGRVRVEDGAKKTDARQLCRALLLSDKAEMDAKPELEIFADDVACSHGCAVGDMDADAMFYVRSRGIDEPSARALLLQAFVDEAINMIPAEEARVYVRGLAERWLHGQG